jgi:hypothetical protein
MIVHALRGRSLELCLKNYYVADQYSVLGIARNAQDGRSPYSDPYSALGDSFYPAEYYRLLGELGGATGTSVIWSWNVVGFLVSCLLIALSAAWALRLAPGSRAWVLAPVPFLLGTLYWWAEGTWLYTSGFAVLWPPFASLYSPGAEGPALLLAGASLLALLSALGTRNRARFAWAAVSGASLGLTVQVHANIAVFTVVAVALVIAWDYAFDVARAARRRAITALGLALLIAAVVGPGSGVSPRLALLLAALTVMLTLDAHWREARGAVVLTATATAIVASLPLSARLASEILSGEGYLYDRQASVSRFDVDLPAGAILLQWLPLWFLVGAVAWWLSRRPKGVHPAWRAALAGVATATLMLAFAGRLGATGLEWHRFLIYGALLTTMLAVPALWLMLRETGLGVRGVGIAVALLLIATLPSTGSFAAAQSGVVTCTPPQEAEAFSAIGAAAGPDRVVLLDRCFAPGPFRVLSGTRTAFVNLGIAAPDDQDLMIDVLNHVRAGNLPDDDVLRASGVTSFLTNTQCGGVPRAELAARFGPPVAVVPLGDEEELGLPPGLVYELYDLPPKEAPQTPAT